MLRCNIRVRKERSQIVENIFQRSKQTGVVTFSLMLFGAMAVSWPLNIRYIANEKRVQAISVAVQISGTQYPVSMYPGVSAWHHKVQVSRYPVCTQRAGAQDPVPRSE